MSWRFMADNNSYVLASRSVIHETVQPRAEYERGEVLPTGFILQKLDDENPDKTLVVSQGGKVSAMWTHAP